MLRGHFASRCPPLPLFAHSFSRPSSPRCLPVCPQIAAASLRYKVVDTAFCDLTPFDELAYSVMTALLGKAREGGEGGHTHAAACCAERAAPSAFTASEPAGAFTAGPSAEGPLREAADARKAVAAAERARLACRPPEAADAVLFFPKRVENLLEADLPRLELDAAQHLGTLARLDLEGCAEYRSLSAGLQKPLAAGIVSVLGAAIGMQDWLWRGVCDSSVALTERSEKGSVALTASSCVFSALVAWRSAAADLVSASDVCVGELVAREALACVRRKVRHSAGRRCCPQWPAACRLLGPIGAFSRRPDSLATFAFFLPSPSPPLPSSSPAPRHGGSSWSAPPRLPIQRPPPPGQVQGRRGRRPPQRASL